MKVTNLFGYKVFNVHVLDQIFLNRNWKQHKKNPITDTDIYTWKTYFTLQNRETMVHVAILIHFQIILHLKNSNSFLHKLYSSTYSNLITNMFAQHTHIQPLPSDVPPSSHWSRYPQYK
jgi:hypothetical protein